MTERGMQTYFGQHMKKFPPQTSEAYELKICKDPSLPFNVVKPHQIEGLLKAENEALYHRVTDQPWTPQMQYAFTLKKPFDCLVLVKVKSYVVVWFYKPRKPKIFIKIPIKAWVAEEGLSNRKSITEQRALEIGEAFHCQTDD